MRLWMPPSATKNRPKYNMCNSAETICVTGEGESGFKELLIYTETGRSNKINNNNLTGYKLMSNTTFYIIFKRWQD